MVFNVLLTFGRKVKVEIVLQVPVSPTLVTCSVTLEMKYDDCGHHFDEYDDHFDEHDDHFYYFDGFDDNIEDHYDH